ncbi:CHAT domain-containing protein, partial [Thiohalorhabdus sp. Cl-TMA]
MEGKAGEGRQQLLEALLGDAAERLADYQSLGAVTDGLVSLVPLEALHLDGTPLVASHRVHYLPTLAGTDTANEGGAGQRALIVADPAFETQVAQAETPQTSDTRDLRAANAGGYFTPLPETMAEAAAVEAALPDYRAERISGEQATEPAVRKALSQNPSLVHFATHGILSGDLPGLTEAALVLADS